MRKKEIHNQTVEKPRRRLMRQSSGGVCAGGKKPTARSIKQDFETFFESFKIRTGSVAELKNSATGFSAHRDNQEGKYREI